MAETLTLADARAGRAMRASGSPELLGRSPAAARVQELVRRAAAVDTGVLIVAETGADVESVARELHARRSPASAFVDVECAAPALDRALFGTPSAAPPDLESVSGSGRLAAARGGTLFLHHLGDMPAGVQARLARIARDGEMRVDGEPAPASIRFVAAATPGIEDDVQQHRFRGDLFRRLSASRIDLPPLRARSDDVPEIASRLLADRCGALSVAPRAFTDAALALLAALAWPGNIAELRQAIDRVASSAEGETHIHVEHLLPALKLDHAPARFAPAGTLREARLRFEREYIAAVLQHHGWRMADAAQTLGIQRPNLYRKARQLGIPLARVAE